MPLVLLLLIGLVVLRLCKINRNGFRWRGELVSPAGLPDAAEDMMGNPRALTPLQLASLPPAINSGAPAASELGVDMHSDICSICMDVYGSDPGRGSTNEAAGATLRQLPCGHVFHAKCIETWLIRQRLCPMCKRNVLLADSEQPAPLLPLPVVPPLRHHLATVATGSIGMCLVTMCELAAVWYCAVDDSKMQAIVPPAAVRGRCGPLTTSSDYHSGHTASFPKPTGGRSCWPLAPAKWCSAFASWTTQAMVPCRGG